MADWLNHVTVAAPRNGTTSHTVTPSTGAVVAGTLFTPTAGNLLVCVVEGPVTSTTPTGWTLPSGGSAVNNTGLYVWYRTAAGSDSFSTTHNTTNFPVAFDFYEFPAGTTFSGAAASTAVSTTGAGPTLSGLTGTNWIAGAAGQANATATVVTATWNVGTEMVDTNVVFATTDGYTYSLTALDSSAAAAQSFTATLTANGGQTSGGERLTFAVKAVLATFAPARRVRRTLQAVNRSNTF